VPEPGDAVLFGTGPSSVFTSLHVGIVEAAYPGYLVTIEGDALHGVRRFVVPTRHPQQMGEPGPIYAYASPVGRAGTQGYRARVQGTALAALRGSVDHQTAHVSSLELRRLLRTIAALRAFQHMPYRIGQARIDWTGVDRRGLVKVSVTSNMPVSYASAEWEQFLERFNDAGHAYRVTFRAPPDPPVDSLPPLISGTPRQAQTLTESHGAWSNNPTTYSYRWEDCDSWGNNCAPIAGATSQTYELTDRDVGHTIRVQEVASNAGGAGRPASSPPTAVIASSSPTPA